MRFFKMNDGLALLAGLSCVFGFAPFGLFPVPVLALAALFVLWQRADTPRAAARSGLSFGLGLFGAGIGWIYVALHDYGDMPMPLALLATFLFAALLALFPALAGYAQARFAVADRVRVLLLMPALWVLGEWVRGMLFTGFPWLTLGYAHSDSPLAGYAPLFGVYGVSLAAALSAGLLVRLVPMQSPLPLWDNQRLGCGLWQLSRMASCFIQRVRERGAAAIFVALLVLWVGGTALRTVAWTQPSGEPFSVALVQGNIAQDIKFNEDALVGTLETYRRLVLQSDARLTVLPETALPLLRHQVPQALVEQLREHAKQNSGDVLIGAFERDGGNYYNSVFALGASENPLAGGEQHYRKHHLVPFGEFIPLRPLLGWFINGVLDIPMGDLARGDEAPPPLQVAGQQVAPDICYEDVFGEEVIHHLPQASVLLNLTNDAWYGQSHAAAQHNQISQMRALETGRMMLRATNTGVTSIIGADGKVVQQLPQHQQAVLLGMAQGYQGATPYVRWGNAAAMLLLIAMLAYAWLRRDSSPLPPSAPSPTRGEGNVVPSHSRGRGWGEGM